VPGMLDALDVELADRVVANPATGVGVENA